jgi:hypothetical protein
LYRETISSISLPGCFAAVSRGHTPPPESQCLPAVEGYKESATQERDHRRPTVGGAKESEVDSATGSLNGIAMPE